MVSTINKVKEVAEADTPLLFFECVLPTTGILPQYWCTHAIPFNGSNYAARVLKHNLFNLQLSADDAMDGITQLSITLADADAQLSQVNNEYGFKGSQLTVYFAFADLPSGAITTESTVLFRGIAGDPDEISENSLSLTFTNKLSLQRVPLPEVRIQRSCPWNFPATADQRASGLSGDRYSRFYRCGYSADIPGGVGNPDGNGRAYTSCDKSRTACEARGMFNIDAANNSTSRFGGFEFVPSAISVRTAGDKTSHVSPLLDNAAKYNDAVPIVYGQGWLKAPVVFSRNDGNLTHIEALLGIGTLTNAQAILKIIVNDVEIPKAVSGSDMTTTGWFNVFALGGRQGGFNSDFADSSKNPLGDPYGSMAAISIVVPNRISSGKSLANVQVLMQGLQVDVYAADETFQAQWSDNPAWIILDVLRRSGWSTQDLNLGTFVTAAEFCDYAINTTDLNGNALTVARYKCNLILTKRQSAATIVRGIRVASSLMLRYGPTGLLELLPETSARSQQPTLPDGGNSTQAFDNGGWPAYEFADGSLPPFSGIVRNSSGGSSLRLTSRSIAESSNRLSVEFQDESNEYQQDSLSIVNADDSALIGYEISSQSTALGIANFSQATRVLLQQLDKSIGGNLYVEFQTSFRALRIRPGDIIALTYLRENFIRTPFRVVKLAPSLNYQMVTVVAQIHNDDWYSDSPVVLGGAGRQPSSLVQTPRPLIGLKAHPNQQALEFFDFEVDENIQAPTNGGATDTLTVSFSQPRKPSASAMSLPLLSLSPQYSATGGTLAEGAYYYAVTGVDAAGNESGLSFTVPVFLATGTNTNSITIAGLSFPISASTFNVYRGITPQLLYQIDSGVLIDRTIADLTYRDPGGLARNIGPPDASFDHANFYWRYQNAGPFQATSFAANGIGNDSMGATLSAYVGMVVRIIEGFGRNQERIITANDVTTLTVSPNWSVVPDATSTFVVAEASWRFAAVSANSPVSFEIPYRAGNVIQISGRGANVNGQEGTADLCPLTQWILGQKAQGDAGVPVMPTFELGTPGGGEVTLSGVGFSDPTSTGSISTGTLQLLYWNELNTPSTYVLTAAIGPTDTAITLPQISGTIPTSFIQIDGELMGINSVNAATNTYAVARGLLGTGSVSHPAGSQVLHLENHFVIVPFAPNFFANRASINYIHTVSLPDTRICVAEFFVSNAIGDSQTNSVAYSLSSSGELRTLSGGQFSLQVSGYLATQQKASPPLVVEASHAVRDLRATVGQAATGYAISVEVLQNGTSYCVMTIKPGETASGPPSVAGVYPPPWPANGVFPDLTPVSGINLPPLLKEAYIDLNVTLQVDPNFQGTPSPGRDLTVTIRL